MLKLQIAIVAASVVLLSASAGWAFQPCEPVGDADIFWHYERRGSPMPERPERLNALETLPAGARYLCDSRFDHPRIRFDDPRILSIDVGSGRRDFEAPVIDQSLRGHTSTEPACVGPLDPPLQAGDVVQVHLRGRVGQDEGVHTIEVGDHPLPAPPQMPAMEIDNLRLPACGPDRGKIFRPIGPAALWYQWQVRDLGTDEIVYEGSGAFPHIHTGFTNVQPGGEYRIYIQGGDHLGQLSPPLEMEFFVSERRNPLILIGALIGACLGGGFLLCLLFFFVVWIRFRRNKPMP